MKTLKLNIDISLSILLFFLLCSIGLSVNTTGDSGDSIVHFFFSRYSFQHPELFLDHWAKPLFVLLSSPFSQFGFKGMIIFNCLAVSLTLFFTSRTSRNLGLQHSWMVFVFILFCPLYFKLIFSGLTEYMFGLFLIIPIFCITKKQYIPAAIIASFTPFIRSEGLIFIGILGLFFAVIKKYREIPMLMTGHIIYSILGFFYYKDFFWVFTKIPYGNMGSPYGHGQLFDFVHRLNYVIEKPMYILLLLGFFALIYRFFRSGVQWKMDPDRVLVYGTFLSLFAAHGIFWWLGVFNSMGLPRVLISLVPEIALIALIGFEFIASRLKPVVIPYVIIVCLAVIVIYPFTPRAEGVVFSKSLWTLPENELIDQEVVPFIQANMSTPGDHPLYYSHAYLSLSLNIDPFNNKQHRDLKNLLAEKLPMGSIIVWDDWFSVVQSNITLDQLKNNKDLELLREFKKPDKNRLIEFAIFVRVSKE